MTGPAARQPAGSRAAHAVLVSNPHEIRMVIYVLDPNAPAPPRVPSSRTIARQREQAEAAARAAAAAGALARQVQPALRPPSGRLFAEDAAGLVLCGPAGGIGSSIRIIEKLVPLAQGGRHPAAVLVGAGKWADETAMRDALRVLAPKSGVIGVRICSRKAGIRMARASYKTEFGALGGDGETAPS